MAGYFRIRLNLKRYKALDLMLYSHSLCVAFCFCNGRCLGIGFRQHSKRMT